MKIKKVLPFLVLSVLFFNSALQASADTSFTASDLSDVCSDTETSEHRAEVAETSANSADTEAGNSLSKETKLKNIRCAKNYEEIYKAIEKYRWRNHYLYVDYESADSLVTAASDNSGATDVNASTAGLDYSMVNTREAGVDEADFVRADGNCIYILSREGRLSIVSADGKDSRIISETACPIETDCQGEEPGYSYDELSRSCEAKEMFIDGDCLNLICDQNLTGYAEWGESEETWRSVDRTVVLTYDISDRSQPDLTGVYSQDGEYLQSRKIDDIIYLFTRYDPFIGDTCEESDLSVYTGGEQLPVSAIIIPDTVTSSSYLIVSSFKTGDPSRRIDAKAYVSGADLFYASKNSIFVFNSNTETYYESTELARFQYDDGQIEPVAAVRLKGYCNDSFSIDEDNGYVRVLTTYFGSSMGAIKNLLSDLLGIDYYDENYWTRHNALYVLDSKLNYVSSLQGIARNEEVRSARFFGDTAYFVTYENTDPLFAADLSDPVHPEILGELDITGFSTYLHPYGDGKLLGMGFESDPDTGTIYGVKLSMFDISNPGAVRETDRTVIKGMVSCDAVQNYKLILADGTKNIIGFYNDNRYFVYRWTEEGGFERVLLYDLYEDCFNQTDYSYNLSVRGVYTGDELYVAGENFLTAFNMKNGFSKDAALEL